MNIEQKLNEYKNEFSAWLEKWGHNERLNMLEFTAHSKSLKLFTQDELEEYVNDITTLENEILEGYGKQMETLDNGEDIIISIE